MSAFFDYDEVTPFLIANPPDEENIAKMDTQLDVNNGIALQTIDKLCLEGKITATETAMYKARYIKLHDALKRSRESEHKLHILMKYCHTELDRQEMELSKAEQFPENAVTEPLMLRAQIINTYNCAMETEERVETLSYEEALLREERKLLKRDFSRFPMSEEMERRFKSLQTQYQETFMEIDMLRLENKRSREQLRVSKDFLDDIRLEHTESQLRLNRVKADCVLATALPGQYIKETEKARKYKSDFEKKIKSLDSQHAILVGQKEKLESELQSVTANNENCKIEIERNKERVDLNKEQTEDLIRSCASWQDLEMVSRTEKAKLTQRFETFASEKKECQQEQSKLKWEKDSSVKQMKKAQAQLDICMEFNTTAVFEKARARLAVTPKYDNTLVKRKEKLNEFLRNLHSDIAEEEKRMAAEYVHINQAVVLSERRLSLLERSRAENSELLQLATSLSEEMARAVCEFNGAFRKHSRLAEDCQIKLRLIERQLDELQTLETRLNDVSNLYMDVKKERNNCVSLLQAAVQVASATRERLRQRGNEAEILLTAAQRSEAQLATVRSTTIRLVAQRDHKRHDLCKVAAAVAVQNAKREQMRLKLNRLTLMYNQAEASSIALKKACERNAKLRNERAILLIERNQEVYLLQEREKYQTIAMASAKMDLSGLEAEYQTSQLYLKQIQHMIHLLREQVPKKMHMEGSVHGLIQELIGIRAHKAQLVAWFEDPDRPGRLRLLGGADPSQSELWVILGRLEKRLAAKEEDLAEKNLTYEAIGRLVDALRVKTDANRDDTLRMAMKVNGIQLKLIKLRKQLETKYAELIISNFEHKKLQNEVRKRERHLDVCMIRALSEMPPSREIAREYRLTKRREQIRRQYKAEKAQGPKKILPMREPIPKLPSIGESSYKIIFGRSPTVGNKSMTR
ncbi:Coiled-coil domain-containing protein [Echinococcus granulosus]|uniref:Coiled coil domain containing protein 146 n=1 Tax=Echinococcus granulosus TaxID=6210 RepID=A0A068WXC2_ECHGR|nr:Coiled-coil domain-containing protein [Echinococcus granulosus]CDS24505.1 coiled coil domain containing protein 146 [Echinococcus granulosus]